MAETLGMLCDKLTIVKLKQFHTEDENRLTSLAKQFEQLQKKLMSTLRMQRWVILKVVR